MSRFRNWWPWRRNSLLSEKPPDVPVPVLRTLTEGERTALEAGLNLAAGLADAPRPLDIHAVQGLYDAFLAEKFDNPDATIALGLAFGEQIVTKADFEWVRVLDEHGEETCVAPRGKSIHCSPISMIQKRLLRNEVVDLAGLLHNTVDLIRTTIEKGGVGNR